MIDFSFLKMFIKDATPWAAVLYMFNQIQVTIAQNTGALHELTEVLRAGGHL